MKRDYSDLVFPVSAVILSLIIVLIASRVKAHSWYEPACCSGVDCGPVDDAVIDEQRDGIHVQGFGVVAYTDPRVRWSRDFEPHLCASKATPPKLLCIYRRPKGN